MEHKEHPNEDPSELITDKHFEAWGRIVWAYAQMESGIKLSMAGILDMLLHEMIILTNPHSASQLKSVAKSIAKLKLSESDAEEFSQILGDWSASSRIRNHISHNRWTFGNRPTSLTPSFIDTHSGKAKFKGASEADEDFTLEDFGGIADKLFRSNVRLVEFMARTGLTKKTELRLQAEKTRQDGETT